jgi:two-component system phosphate regulon sensor histidine kinase PhoR
VTIIGLDGVVLGDSEIATADLAKLENHRGRPEVIAALAAGRGASVRHSATLARRMMYVAIPFHRAGQVAGTVRISMPLTTVDQAVGRVHRLLLAAAGLPLLETIRHGALKELIDRASSEPSTSGEIEVAGLKPRRLLVHASRLVDGPPGLLAVFVDVTDIRRLESLRRDFVANVSHELRTPITAVRSAAETLRTAVTADPAAAASFLGIIERNAERLQRLVEDLLDLSHIESREFRLKLEAVAPDEAVDRVLSLFRERAERKRVRLAAHVPRELPAIQADRRALEQVLTNLVDNAIKYCPEGARITVEGTADSEAVNLTVVDSGPGIEKRHCDRLFERFYRVDAGRSRELGGTGLGLSIVKHLAEVMRGTVNLESTVGQGSRFTVRLPRR